MSRIAVVLFNLGGPDGPEAVRPFLKNLFSDPAIIDAPGVIRLPLAELIARSRTRLAQENYAVMGGASPLNAETQAQADALATRLREVLPGDDVSLFVAMRYWRPLTEDAAAEVASFAPDEVVLLPLYPQFSTTTTGSSLDAWRRAYRGPGRMHGVCCYFDDPALTTAHAARIQRTWVEAGSPEAVRLLFSAHGLPQRTSDAGDPYRWQVEQTCARVAERLTERTARMWDWRLCFQSRVGPMKWIGPETTAEIERAGADGKGVIVDPIAFVSEHVETLVELDRDYAALAERVAALPYLRVATMRDDPTFIGGLAALVVRALAREGLHPGGPACGAGCARCALKARKAA